MDKGPNAQGIPVKWGGGGVTLHQCSMSVDVGLLLLRASPSGKYSKRL